MEVITVQDWLQEYFKSQNVQLTLVPDKTPKKLSSVEEFHGFIQKEVDFWQECTSGKTNRILQHFQSIYSNFQSALNTGDQTQGTNYITSAIHLAKSGGFPCIYSGSYLGRWIKQSYQQNVNQADSMIAYLFENTILPGGHDRNYLIGTLNALFLDGKNNMHLTSLEIDRAGLKDLQDSYTEQIKRSIEDYELKYNKTEALHVELQAEMNTWKDNVINDNQQKYDERLVELNKLEVLYKEKLRLEGPAKHWNDLYGGYQKTGRIWLIGVATLTICTVLLLTLILFNRPSGLYIENGKFDFNALKGTIIFTIITSVSIYLISLFVKVSLSSFHLARDAKERYQLTHIYLSLLNENAIVDSDRGIILQSLFSRADTGLLKGDTGPAFPDSLSNLSKLIK